RRRARDARCALARHRADGARAARPAGPGEHARTLAGRGAGRVNLIVYVSDALRADYVGCYGARRVNTRTIDELAAWGARFDDAVATAPWTCPSTTSMITALYPHHHHVLHWDAPLDPAVPTLFSVAAANGYATGSFVFDEDFLFKGVDDANVAGTSETL